MAILDVRQEQPRQKRQGPSNLDKLGAAASVAGSVYSGNPFAMGAAGINAINTFKPVQQFAKPDPAANEASSAIARRSELLAEDPMQSLREAKNALAQSGLSQQERAALEAPILRALSTSQQRRT